MDGIKLSDKAKKLLGITFPECIINNDDYTQCYTSFKTLIKRIYKIYQTIKLEKAYNQAIQQSDGKDYILHYSICYSKYLKTFFSIQYWDSDKFWECIEEPIASKLLNTHDIKDTLKGNELYTAILNHLRQVQVISSHVSDELSSLKTLYSSEQTWDSFNNNTIRETIDKVIEEYKPKSGDEIKKKKSGGGDVNTNEMVDDITELLVEKLKDVDLIDKNKQIKINDFPDADLQVKHVDALDNLLTIYYGNGKESIRSKANRIFKEKREYIEFIKKTYLNKNINKNKNKNKNINININIDDIIAEIEKKIVELENQIKTYQTKGTVGKFFSTSEETLKNEITELKNDIRILPTVKIEIFEKGLKDYWSVCKMLPIKMMKNESTIEYIEYIVKNMDKLYDREQDRRDKIKEMKAMQEFWSRWRLNDLDKDGNPIVEGPFGGKRKYSRKIPRKKSSKKRSAKGKRSKKSSKKSSKKTRKRRLRK